MPFKSRAQKEYLRINEPEIYERWMREYGDGYVVDAESNQSFTPPAAAVAAAKKGLAQRKKWGRGGLSPAEAASQGIDSGVTRARKISSGKVSRHDVRRMSAFNRHRKNNNPSKKMPDGGPTAGTIAWNLWGGTSGVNWAKKKSAAMNAEDFDAESWSPKKSMKQWMQHEEQTEEEVTWDYFHANLYPPNKLLTKIWTFEGKPNGSVEAWWNTITNQDDDEQREQLEEVFERHYPIILKSARKDVQQLIEEHNWYDMMSAETFNALSPICKRCGLSEAGSHQLDPTGETGICIICTFNQKMGLNAEGRFSAEKYYEEDPERYYNPQFEPYDSFPTKDSAEQLYIKTKDFINTWSEGWDDYRTANHENGGYFTSLNAVKKDANKEAKYYARKGFFPFYQSEKPSGINFNCQKREDGKRTYNRAFNTYSDPKKDYTERVEIKYELIEKMGAETFESPVSCKICGKTFDSFRGLNGHMNAHLPPHRKRAEEEEEEDELRTYEVSVPVLHYYGIGPVEAYDEDEAADEVRNNWGYWRRTIQDNGDWGGPLWRYSPLTSGEPEAYEIFDSETFGDVDSDGQLAQALRAAREKSRRYAPQPLRITKLPHPDQKSLKDFEAETKELPFSVSRKDIALVSFGAILGVVSGVIGEVLAEFWLDRYRRDPELLTNGDDENA